MEEIGENVTAFVTRLRQNEDYCKSMGAKLVKMSLVLFSHLRLFSSQAHETRSNHKRFGIKGQAKWSSQTPSLRCSASYRVMPYTASDYCLTDYAPLQLNIVLA